MMILVASGIEGELIIRRLVGNDFLRRYAVDGPEDRRVMFFRVHLQS